MSIAREIFLYLLTDEQGRSYYLDNGILQYSSAPVWLQDSPQGWLDNTISFGRSTKYYGLNRSFTIPLKFVNDGASIIRKIAYEGKGVESQLNLIVLKRNDETDIYEMYYKGELDLVMMEDLAAEGVQVNVIEGGLVKYVKSFESTTFEIPCDGSIPENKLVKITGILFNDTFNYSATNLPDVPIGKSYATPIVFLSNTGDNVGVEKGDESFEDITDQLSTYFLTSGNYIYKSIYPVQITITGTFSVNGFGGSGAANCNYSLVTSKNRTFPLVNEQVPNGQTITRTRSITISLAAGEALFAFIDNPLGGGCGVSINEASFTLKFKSKYPNSYTWGIDAYDLYRLLVKKLSNGKYEGKSDLLQLNRNLVLTPGDALRQFDKAVLKTSLTDFFESLNTILNASLSDEQIGTGRNKLFFEKKEYVFNSSVIDIDLGEVSELKISVANEYLFNIIKAGYAPQNYDERAGRQEFNTTAQFKANITRVQKDLTIISRYRADSYGIERTRFETGDRSATSNSSDNSVFILNINTTPEPQQYVASRTDALTITTWTNKKLSFQSFLGAYFTPDANSEVFTSTFNGYLSHDIALVLSGQLSGNNTQKLTAKIYQNNIEIAVGQIFATSTTGAPYTLNLNVTVAINKNDLIRVELTNTGTLNILTSASLTFQSASLNQYNLLRETYTTIQGIDNPETAYNIEQLTPARIIKTWGNWIRSALYNQPDTKLTFQTLDKNKDLFTVRNGVTYKESDDIRVSDLDAPLFLPYIIEFKTKVPYNFQDIFNGAANKHLKGTYNGVDFYGFPIQVQQKAALNEAQEWKLLCSPITKPSDFVNLDVDGLNYLNLMQYGIFVPHLCPIKLVPLGNILPAQYHTKHMDGWWFTEQVQNYVDNYKYYQPWQNNDVISLQVQTNGLGPVKVEIYNCLGEVVLSVDFTQKSDPSVKAPLSLFEANVALTSLSEGLYYAVVSAGSGAAIAKYISEPLYVKADWPNTILFEYKNSRNKQSVVFTTGYNPSIRIESSFTLQDFDAEAKYTVYENQPADIELINGIPYRVHNLFIGDNQGLPPWVLDKLARITLMSECKADGLAITRNSDSKFERISIPGYAMSYYNLKVREKYNRDGVFLDVNGDLDKNITVVYNVNTKGFGDGSGGDQIVQVTHID